jgi:hypothetical protein
MLIGPYTGRCSVVDVCPASIELKKIGLQDDQCIASDSSWCMERQDLGKINFV